MNDIFVIIGNDPKVLGSVHYYSTCSTLKLAQELAKDLLLEIGKKYECETVIYSIPGGYNFALRKLGSAVYLYTANIYKDIVLD